jgi:hypothetical protein
MQADCISAEFGFQEMLAPAGSGGRIPDFLPSARPAKAEAEQVEKPTKVGSGQKRSHYHRLKSVERPRTLR